MTEKTENISAAYHEKSQKAETWSGIPLEEIYTPKDTEGIDYERDLGDAGEYPFTRGIHRSMYRGKHPTRRIICGFGSATDTNKRLRFNLEQGFTGLDVYPDVAGVIHLDADHPRVEDEAGVQGVSISSLQDFEDLVEGIPLDEVSVLWRTFLTIPYLSIVAERQGLNLASLRGTILNPHPLVLMWVEFPPGGFSNFDLWLRLAVDTVEYCTRKMPKFYATYIDGYNLREYGLSAPQELAWAFSQGIAYIDAILERGLDIDEFGPRITFFLTTHKDFFEEIAKFRAARRMWAKIMKERYGATDPRSMQFRFAVETAGSSLTAQQPLNNIIRITYQAIAAMLGGVQSMSPPSYLEGVSLPTEESAMLQVRTQQILTYETGIPNVTDPLGGSYYVEHLTDKLEAETNKILREIEDQGGIEEAAKSGWVDQMIDEAVFKRQKEVENNERTVVGVNAFTIDESETPGGYFKNPAHDHERGRGKEVVNRVKRLKETRDNHKVKAALDKLRVKAEDKKANLIPLMIDAAKAYATQGEIMGTIRQAYGLAYDPFGDIESPF
jgi:methylmalonyl-CoA mutase N-terminal domain/subunit